MQKFILILLTLILYAVSFQSNATTECSRYTDLSPQQKENLEKAYIYGLPNNYGFTLAAIALQESNAGEWRVNFRTSDFGLMQINITTAYRELGITNHYRQLELAERLIYDDELNLYLATRVLDHFRQGRVLTNAVWREMVMRYNIGWTNTEQRLKRGNNHLNGVTSYVRLLQQCTEWSDINE